jgi:hypothetical protein
VNAEPARRHRDCVAAADVRCEVLFELRDDILSRSQTNERHGDSCVVREGGLDLMAR